MTAAAIYALLIGEVGIAHDTLMHTMKYWQIRAALQGYRRRHRSRWDAARWQTYMILSALGAEVKSPQELLPLPWDATAAADSLTDAEFFALQADMAALNNKK